MSEIELFLCDFIYSLILAALDAAEGTFTVPGEFLPWNVQQLDLVFRGSCI